MNFYPISTISQFALAQTLKAQDFSVYMHELGENGYSSKQGADLQISGHTHGGQLFPVSLIEKMKGMLVYGEFQFGDMKQIVSSGLTGWGWLLYAALSGAVKVREPPSSEHVPQETMRDSPLTVTVQLCPVAGRGVVVML